MPITGPVCIRILPWYLPVVIVYRLHFTESFQWENILFSVLTQVESKQRVPSLLHGVSSIMQLHIAKQFFILCMTMLLYQLSHTREKR